MSIKDIFKRKPIEVKVTVDVDLTLVMDRLEQLLAQIKMISPPCKYCAGNGRITTAPNHTATTECPRCAGTGMGRMAAE